MVLKEAVGDRMITFHGGFTKQLRIIWYGVTIKKKNGVSNNRRIYTITLRSNANNKTQKNNRNQERCGAG